jgi:hypothetical protein
MQVAENAKKEILEFIEKKIDTDEIWAEAFTKLIGLDEPDQNGAVWDMLESVNDSMRWDELFARSPEVLERMGESALKSLKEGKTISMEEFLELTLELTGEELLTRFPSDDARFHG